MKQIELEKKLANFLRRRRKSNGVPYGKRYVKDKISRLRRVASFVPMTALTNVNEGNYIYLIELVIEHFKNREYRSGEFRQINCGDYLVVIRLLYEMNNKGKKAKRYMSYRGVIHEARQ